MNVGILTFHRAVNYGAILQAYALQRTIELLGDNAEIIDYRCEFIENEVSPLSGFRKKDKFVKTIKKFVFRSIKSKAFDKFMNGYLNLSPVIKKNEELNKLNSRYDCFITGSDQVWNYGCSGSDTSFFLDFVQDDSKKNSYAASFGFDKLPTSDPFDYQKLLKDYNKISVREKSGAQIVFDKIGVLPQVTLDPTLLLDRKEWKKIVLKRPLKEKYIFVYYIREPKDLLKYVDQLAERTKCKIINSKKSVEFLKKCSPADFLTWIYHADYVVTNSFHGTVFSILFNKKFVVELDNGKSINNRSKELMEVLDVKERELDIYNIDSIKTEIDYLNVENKLQINKEKSILYIKSILNK